MYAIRYIVNINKKIAECLKYPMQIDRNDANGQAGFPLRLQTCIGGESARAFSRKIGISPSTMGQYLSGKSEPTRPVLIAIADASGVSVDWLATGRGAPEGAKSFEYERRVRDLEAEKARLRDELTEVRAAMAREVNRLSNELGLGDIALMARRGIQELSWNILVVLDGCRPDIRTVPEILDAVRARGLRVEAEDVQAELAVLMRRNSVVNVDSAYRISDTVSILKARELGDMNQAAQHALRTLTKVIVPQAEKKSGTGYFTTIVVKTEAGKGSRLVSRLRQTVFDLCRDVESEPGTEQVVVLLGAALE